MYCFSTSWVIHFWLQGKIDLQKSALMTPPFLAINKINKCSMIVNVINLISDYINPSQLWRSSLCIDLRPCSCIFRMIRRSSTNRAIMDKTWCYKAIKEIKNGLIDFNEKIKCQESWYFRKCFKTWMCSLE